jgi:chromosome segregation ATPase
MADDFADIRDRQDRLEGRVTVLEVTVMEEASLRAKMDSDLGEMRTTLIAHKHSLQALHETQSDHTKRLTRIEDKVGRLEEQMGDVRIGVHAILDLLDTHLVRKPRWLRLPRRNRRSANL